VLNIHTHLCPLFPHNTPALQVPATRYEEKHQEEQSLLYQKKPHFAPTSPYYEKTVIFHEIYRQEAGDIFTCYKLCISLGTGRLMAAAHKNNIAIIAVIVLSILIGRAINIL
jgi:hypothetical protein